MTAEQRDDILAIRHGLLLSARREGAIQGDQGMECVTVWFNTSLATLLSACDAIDQLTKEKP